jgi:hypothetical protein
MQVICGNGDVISALEDALARARAGELHGVVICGIGVQDGQSRIGWGWGVRDDARDAWSRMVASVGAAQHDLMVNGLVP